jgi:alkanesulfonate monooxygenase SsuD/methylene tetrahydromethanopterin reductase-like flavin-dependent oxidoreductase (luciferase family)
MLEQEGYASLWSAQAMGRGFMLTDPFIALATAAAVTEKVELGTAILQLPFYDPVDIALKSFSLMQASGNRLLLGVGAGSTAVDFQLHEKDFDTRFGKFNHDLETLRQWFTTGEADGHSISPWKEVQGGPPLVYGTWGKGVARAAKEFDAWVASGMYRSVEELTETIKDYQEAGGKRAIVSTIVLNAETDLGELGERLSRYSEAGFDDALVMFSPGAPAPSDVRKLVNTL